MKHLNVEAPCLPRPARATSEKQPSLWFHLPLLVLCMMGPMANFGNTSLSIMNIASILIGPILMARLAKSRITQPAAFAIGGFAILLFLSIITLATDTLDDGLLYSRDVFVSLFFFVLAIFWMKYLRDKLEIALSVVVIFLFAVALLQYTHESFGFGLDPNLSDEFYIHAESAGDIGYPSTFGNPNNFAAFILPIFILLIFEKKDARNIFLIVICAISLLLAGSRMALISAIVGLLFLQGHTKMVAIAFVLAALAFLVTIYNTGFALNIYVIDRLLDVMRISSSGLSTENSIGLRILSHQMFLENFDEFIIGSFSPSHMCPQFSGLSYRSNLLEYSPHSLIIELHCLFGIGGTFVLSLFIFGLSLLFYESRINKSKRFLIFLVCIAVTTIPSNVFRSSHLFFSLGLFIVSLAANWDRRLGGKAARPAAATLPGSD